MTTETVLRINPINYATDLYTITVSELQLPVDFPENQMKHWQHATGALTYAQNNRVNQDAAFFAALLTYEVLANSNISQSLKDDVWERYQNREHQAIYDLVLQARTVDLICDKVVSHLGSALLAIGLGMILIGSIFVLVGTLLTALTVTSIITCGVGAGIGLLLLMGIGIAVYYYYESEKRKIAQNNCSFLNKLGEQLPKNPVVTHPESEKKVEDSGVTDYVGNFFSGIGAMCSGLATGCSMGLNVLDGQLPGWGLFP